MRAICPTIYRDDADKQMAAKAYQFRQMLKHEYMKPPTIMPATELAEPLSDSQAPIVPPTAMLASNQKIQIASLVNGACRFGAHHFLGMSAPIGSAPLASNRPPTCWLASHHGVIERMLMAFECSALPSMASEPPAIRVCSLAHMPPTISLSATKSANKWRQITGLARR